MTLKDKTQYDFGGYCSTCLNKLKECTCKSIDFKMDIKDKIRLIRHKVSQKELARQIGWSQRSFSNWMNGRRNIPKDKLEKLEGIVEGLRP
jgi:DNA-binding transcriptional regulator YiaG